MAAVVKPHSFKVLEVDSTQPLKQFLNKCKLPFVKGFSFYQMTKGEVIQDYKQLVVMRKSDKAFITGEKVRDVLKIPMNMVTRFVLDTDQIPDFLVFVQSTSHNRKLIGGTKMLYQVDDAIGASEPKETSSEPASEAETRRTTRSRAAKRKAGPAETEEKPKAATRTPSSPPKTKRATKAEPETKEEDSKDIKTSSTKSTIGPIEIAFSFDTTGSMYACLSEVRRRIKATITRLKRDIPGIRMAVIAHGDYIDKNTTYITKICDFTEDAAMLCKFVNDVQCTMGGDFDECYELVLREAQTKLSWKKDSEKSLVVIGDATPHSPSYPDNTEKIDWKTECDALRGRGIKIYSVQCLNRSESTSFFETMAVKTNGFHLKMNQFGSVVDFMMAICYREQGPDQLQHFEDEVRTRGMNRELHLLFDQLHGRSTNFTNASATASTGLTPVDPARFQVLAVDSRCSIKDFVQANALIFKTGRGFYEFTKPETISHKKEVVLVDKVTGDMFTGTEACRMIGAGVSGKVEPANFVKFRVFVQSTSYNRVLMPDTGFLYEVDPDR